MSFVLQEVRLLCQNGSSNKFYNVQVVFDGVNIQVVTTHGAIGAQPRNGVVGQVIISNVIAKIEGGTLKDLLHSLLFEARGMVRKKLKSRGYVHASRGDDFSINELIKNVEALFPNAKFMPKAMPAPAGAIIVEVMSFNAEEIKVSQVNEHYEYGMSFLIINNGKHALRTMCELTINKEPRGNWSVFNSSVR